MISLVFAVGEQLQFGHNGTMPWPHLKEDMNKFKDVTRHKVVVMGRNTFESLPKLLPDRLNIVLSSTQEVYARSGQKPDLIFDDLELLKTHMTDNQNVDYCVIGGPSMLYQFYDLAEEVHMTVVSCATMPPPYHCDVLLDSDFTKEIASNMNIQEVQKLVTCEGLNVVYTKFKK
ncbi:dihydrofolate reductase [Aeromonas phage Aswh_1]|nr:dihydrofolate reductase [Aeromonas phage Aswh_1]